VVGTEHSLAVGDGALQQRDGLVLSSGLVVGHSEVAAGGQRLGIVAAQNAFPACKGGFL